MSKQLMLNPALIIGIGGSGQKVLNHLKATFLKNPVLQENYAKDGVLKLPTFIQLLCIDTDKSAVDHGAEAGTRLADEDFFKIHVTDAKEMMSHFDLDDFRHIANWFPKSLKPYADTIETGAHQFRFLGRFGLFAQVSKVYKAILDKLGQVIALGTVSPDAKIIPATDKGVIATPEIVVVGSLCGGSGAGMFLDVAYLAKMAYYQLMGGKTNPRMTGIQFTADTFASVHDESKQLTANSYASLTELFYFMSMEHVSARMKPKNAKEIKAFEQRCTFKVDYGPVGKTHENFGQIHTRPPFDRSYILGTGSLTDNNTYFSIASEFLFSTMIGDGNGTFRSEVDNMALHVAGTTGPANGNQLKCFNSFGCKSFYYPVEDLKELYTCRLAVGLSGWLKSSGSNIDIARMASDFVNANSKELGLDVESLILNLKQLTPRAEYWDNKLYHSFVGSPTQGEDESATAFILRRLREVENARVKRPELKTAIMRKLEETGGIAQKTAEVVKRKVVDIINDPQMGIDVAADFLNLVLKSLSSPGQLSARETELTSRNNKEKAEFTRARSMLQEKLSSFMGLGGTFMELGTLLNVCNLQDEFNTVIKEANDEVSTQYELFYFSLAKDYVKSLVKQVEPLKQQINVLKDMLSALGHDGKWQKQYESCLDRFAGLTTEQKFIRANICDVKDVEPFCNHLMGSSSPDQIEKDFLAKADMFENWDAFTNPKANALENAVWNYCKKRVEAFDLGGIEDFLNWKGPEYLQNLIKSMLTQASPLIALNDHGELIPRGRIIHLGVPDNNSKLAITLKDSLLKMNSEFKVSTVPTRNRFEVSLLNCQYGIAPYNLASLPQWEGYYKKNNSNITCHAILNNADFPVLWRSFGLIPAKNMEKLFMTYIYLRYEYTKHYKDGKERNGIYWNETDMTFCISYQDDAPQAIGHTLPKIFSFLSNGAMGAHLIKEFDAFWADMNTPQRLAFINRHIDNIKSSVLNLEEKIQKAILKGNDIDKLDDETLAIERGILAVLSEKQEEFSRIVRDGASAAGAEKSAEQ